MRKSPKPFRVEIRRRRVRAVAQPHLVRKAEPAADLSSLILYGQG